MKTLQTLALFVYVAYLEADWTGIKPWAQKILYPFWLLKWAYVVPAALVGFPLVWAHFQREYNPTWIAFEAEYHRYWAEILKKYQPKP